MNTPSREATEQARAEIVRIGRLMYDKGFIVAGDGNLSIRLGPDRLLATPSGAHKGFLRPQDLIITDMNGQKISPAEPDLRPTSEMPMHLEVYRQRPDAGAVVHAHPPTTVALSIANVRMNEPILPEVVITLGSVPTAEYATPSSRENVGAIKHLIADHDGIVLKRHGALTVGPTLFDAFMKLETIEHYARILFQSTLLGCCHPLAMEQVDKLLAIRQAMGIGVDKSDNRV